MPVTCRVIFVWVGTLYRVAKGRSASRFTYRYFQYSRVTHNFISNSRITNFNYNKRVEYLAFQHFYLKYFLFAFNKDLHLPHIGKSYCDKAFLKGNVTERRQMNWSWIHSITCDCHYRVGTHKIFPCKSAIKPERRNVKELLRLLSVLNCQRFFYENCILSTRIEMELFHGSTCNDRDPKSSKLAWFSWQHHTQVFTLNVSWEKAEYDSTHLVASAKSEALIKKWTTGLYRWS